MSEHVSDWRVWEVGMLTPPTDLIGGEVRSLTPPSPPIGWTCKRLFLTRVIWWGSRLGSTGSYFRIKYHNLNKALNDKYDFLWNQVQSDVCPVFKKSNHHHFSNLVRERLFPAEFAAGLTCNCLATALPTLLLCLATAAAPLSKSPRPLFWTDFHPTT